MFSPAEVFHLRDQFTNLEVEMMLVKPEPDEPGDTRMYLIETLCFQWAATVAADPEYALNCWDFLRSNGITEDAIWEFSPQIGWDAAQPEPDWL